MKRPHATIVTDPTDAPIPEQSSGVWLHSPPLIVVVEFARSTDLDAASKAPPPPWGDHGGPIRTTPSLPSIATTNRC